MSDPTEVELNFEALSNFEAKNLLRAVFRIMEYDDDGEPGRAWSPDQPMEIAEQFDRFGITFTPPEGLPGD